MAQAPMIRKIREFLLGGPALTKPGNVYVPSSGSTPMGSRRTVRPLAWQYTAWRYWGLLGEIRFPTEHLARQVGRLDWDITIDGVEVPADEAARLMDEVTFGLGVNEASRLGGLNLQVGGEGWYIEQVSGMFAFYSIISPGLEKMVEEARRAGRMAIRVYIPHPVNPDKPESALVTAFGPAEELLTLTGLSIAQSRSRISQAGMVLVDSRVEFEDGSDPFGADLERAMEAAIEDVTSPAAMVPIKVELDPGEGKVSDLVHHLTFDRKYDEKLPGRVEAAIKRIALAIDVPAELVLGTGDANHWTAWLTALETYTSHLEPLALPLGELWAEVLETLLIRAGRRGVVKVTPNPKRILAKRSTIRDAIDSARLGAVGLKYVRTAIGAKDEDAPTPEDLEIILRIPREPGREPLVDEQAGEPVPSGPDPVSASLNPAVSAGAMAVAAATARAKAGAKLRAAVMSDADLRAKIDGIPNEDAVFVLGAGFAEERIDVNQAVLEGLAGFRTWWTTTAPGPASPTVATNLLAIWVANTLDQPTSELAIPPHVVDEVTSGRLKKGATSAA